MNFKMLILLLLTGMTTANAKGFDCLVITNNGDSLKLRLDIPYFLLLDRPKIGEIEDKIRVLDNDSIKKITVTEVKSASFVDKGEVYHLVPKCFDDAYISKSCFFVRLLVEGDLQLIYYSVKVREFKKPPTYPEYLRYQRENGDFHVFPLFFNKTVKSIEQLKKVLGNCPMLIEKLEKGEIPLDDHIKIAKEYNSLCKRR
ncbi:MAG TPA: hypothetical protein VK175_13510 [Leadbetterella sp.]|nr:hypothetical protein [Leadbetterella sp.]